eukprot:CAMPEP_0182452268 /NCGR_PEP_ID=MMETSP1172-20130603/44162_1 /TAXON_ID=708627 /ORGANISM="Timspurckia oligopyrenoides, Strain CCMP3278" /LENGTH=408 /DNA_ID=CAMNT_0024650093 /DNA_START=27 /DNA_END=1256 /DNA_ORIENTATION=+
MNVLKDGMDLEELENLVKENSELLDAELVQQVLNAVDNDATLALPIFYDMIASSECNVHDRSTSDTLLDTKSQSLDTKITSTSGKNELTLSLNEFHSLSLSENPVVHAPKGVWNHRNGGGFSLSAKVQAERMHQQYPWVTLDVLVALFEQCDGNASQVEELLISMFPVDEPIAFASSSHSQSFCESDRISNSASKSAATSISAANRTEISDTFRESPSGLGNLVDKEQVYETLRKFRIPPAQAKPLEPLIADCLALRSEFELRRRTKLISRSVDGIAHVKDLQNSLQSTIERLLVHLSKHCDSFGTTGDLDLHGFYVEDAVALCGAKLLAVFRMRLHGLNTPKRVQFICGRGQNSGKGGARIRPALIHFLRSSRLSYSIDDHGGIVEVNTEKGKPPTLESILATRRRS